MKPVMFTFRSDVSREAQDQVLATIDALDGVTKAGRLKPDARDPDVARLAFAYVDDDTDVARFVLKLSKLPQIEVASVPSQRSLIR